MNIRNYRESEDAATVTVGKSIGKPVLGGPFQLIDHNKKVSLFQLNVRFRFFRLVMSIILI